MCQVNAVPSSRGEGSPPPLHHNQERVSPPFEDYGVEVTWDRRPDGSIWARSHRFSDSRGAFDFQEREHDLDRILNRPGNASTSDTTPNEHQNRQPHERSSSSSSSSTSEEEDVAEREAVSEEKRRREEQDIAERVAWEEERRRRDEERAAEQAAAVEEQKRLEDYFSHLQLEQGQASRNDDVRYDDKKQVVLSSFARQIRDAIRRRDGHKEQERGGHSSTSDQSSSGSGPHPER